jgi:hypothetical protein
MMVIQLTIIILVPIATNATNVQPERKVCLVKYKCVGGEIALLNTRVSKKCKKKFGNHVHSGIGCNSPVLLYHTCSLTQLYGVNDSNNVALIRRYVSIYMQMKGSI